MSLVKKISPSPKTYKRAPAARDRIDQTTIMKRVKTFVDKVATLRVDTRLSKTPLEAHHRVLNLYRLALRHLPGTLQVMEVTAVSEQDCREIIKRKFRANSDITDIKTVDILRTKGEMELGETVRMFKTRSHVLNMFDPVAAETMFDRRIDHAEHDTFLQRFLK